MTNFVKRGDHLTLAAPYDVLSGGGFKVGNVFGVAANDTLSGTDVECTVEGVYDLAKDSSTFAQGDLAYWDDSAKKVTSTVASNLLIGAVEVAAATGVATVRVNLFGVPGFSGQAHGVKVAHALYDYSVDGGATCTPANSDTIPDNAVVLGGVVNSTAAVTASGSATVSIGTAAGSGAASILTATGKASLSLDAVVVPTCVATPFKMTAAGKINVTIATGPLTAGVIEVWVLYTVAAG
jgi:predicted RecA/RadA family phage recombinase